MLHFNNSNTDNNVFLSLEYFSNIILICQIIDYANIKFTFTAKKHSHAKYFKGANSNQCHIFDL